ncbi:MAG: hypothetical protein IRZ26_04085 [Clostridia bacterium]|nr:hypothetical protein [Clostridia bacterium]
MAGSEPGLESGSPVRPRPRVVLVGDDPQLEEALRTPGGPRLVARLQEVESALPVLAQIRPEVVVAAESAAPGEPFSALLAGMRALLPGTRLLAVTSGAIAYDVQGVDELRLPWSLSDVLERAGWPAAGRPPALAGGAAAGRGRLAGGRARIAVRRLAPPAPGPVATPDPSGTAAAAGERERSWQRLEAARREEAARFPVRTLRPQVAVILGAQGGAGKTSLAVNLAALLAARTDARLLLVDMGLEGADASVQLELLDAPGLADLLPFAGRLESAEAQASIRHHRLGFDVVAGLPRPELAQLIDATQVELLLRGCLARYDVTLVDTAPAPPPELARALAGSATQLFLVTTAEPPALRRLRLFLEQEEVPWPRERMQLVFTRLRPGGPVPPAQAARELGFERWFELPEAGEALERSAYVGRPLVLDQPDHPFSRAAGRLATQLAPFARAEGGWTDLLREGWARLSSAWIRDRNGRG